MPLHDAIGVVARQSRVDEREQQPLAEVETAAFLEVPTHLLGTDDEALDEPGEALEHVVEREERVGNDDTLGRFLRDPKGALPGNRMAFPGIKDDEELADLLAYLKQATQ